MTEGSHLHQRFPGLNARLPWRSLGTQITPVVEMSALANRAGMRSLFVKRDDLTHSQVGGSVVRKLEYIFAHAESRDAYKLLSYGPLGSELASALAVHAPPLGMKSDYIAYSKNAQSRHMRYSKEAESLGLHVHQTHTGFGARVRANIQRHVPTKPRTYFVPQGGGPRGALGFVNAAIELAEQISRGELSEPSTIFVPANTGVAVAGLSVGLQLAGISSRVVGVALQSRWRLNNRAIRSISHRTVALLRGAGCREAIPPKDTQMILLHGFSSGALQQASESSQKAVSLARDTERLHLDPSRSGKVLTAILDQALSWPEFRDSTVLFWNTSSDR
jgi:D-cysteine desulfhydrase